MKATALIDLRKELDDIIGPARRKNLFEFLFHGLISKYPVMHTDKLVEAEYIAQSLRYLDFEATVEQQATFPNYHTVWVKL